MAPGEVGMSLPCPSASRLLRPFFKSHNFFIMENWPLSEEFYVKVESLKFQQFHLMKFDFFQSFNFDQKFLSNLEVEGQGRGIIMGVTHLLLLGPFYYIAL